MATQLFSYALIGKKGDFNDFISNISPDETPFISMVGSTKADNVDFTFYTDTLSDATAPDTGIGEGADYVFDDGAQPTSYQSFTQIFRTGLKVSGTAQATGLYGRANPMAYQLQKAGKEQKIKIEKAMLSAQTGKASAGAIGSMLDGFATTRSDGAVITNTKTAAVAGTFSEAELEEVLIAGAEKGMKDSIIMFPLSLASQISALRTTDTAQNMFDGEVSVDVNRKVDVYIDVLGHRHKLIPNKNMPAGQIYVISPEYLEQRVLRGFETKDAPANGDYVAKVINVELGLANLNPDAHAIYTVGTATP